MTRTLAAVTFGDEDVHMKDKEDEDHVLVAHEEEKGIIIKPYEEAITAANEVLPPKEEELVTVAEERTQKQDKLFDVIHGQRRERLTTETESGIPALAKLFTPISAESTSSM